MIEGCVAPVVLFGDVSAWFLEVASWTDGHNRGSGTCLDMYVAARELLECQRHVNDDFLEQGMDVFQLDMHSAVWWMHDEYHQCFIMHSDTDTSPPQVCICVRWSMLDGRWRDLKSFHACIGPSL